jgi:hypothetical protein
MYSDAYASAWIKYNIMDVEATYKSIRSVYQTLSGKSDTEVSMTYKGNGYGVTKPWQSRIGDREYHHENHAESLLGLLSLLKNELLAKAKSAEQEAQRLHEAINQLGT